ncbi:MAG: hypothetical protein ACLPVO_03930 [Desulfomonilaceae bacterium]
MTFKERLGELLNGLPVDDPRAKVDLQLYFKWRIQAKWLLVYHLGEDHPYTKELITIFGTDLAPYFLGNYILTAEGVMEALLEDLDTGMIQVNESRRWRKFLKRHFGAKDKQYKR